MVDTKEVFNGKETDFMSSNDLISECTEGALNHAFDFVSDDADWRGPIDVTVSHAKLDELGGWHTVYTAIGHYTATTPKVKYGVDSVRITAPGYRAGAAGDH